MARKIEIEVVGDTKSLDRALSRTTKSTQSSFQKMGKAAGVAGLAIGGGLAIAAKIGFDELSEMQKATAQTEAVLKSTGGAANVTSEHVRDLAESISAYSGADDEAVQSAENLLLTFHKIRNETGKGNDVFDQATKVVADLSQAMGMDLNAAALQVGKALNDPLKGMSRLQRIGVSFTKGQEKTIEKLVETGDVIGAQRVILAELNKEFGGSARAFGETMPGQLKIAQESFRNLSAELMIALLPAFNRLAELLQRLAGYLRQNPKLAKAVVIGLAALAAALLTASAAQMALNLAVLANPYVAAAVAIIALGVAITILIKKVDFARKHWQLLLIGIGAGPVIVATVVKAIIRHFGTLEAGFTKIKAVAAPVFNFVADQIRGIANVVQTVINAIQTLIGWINKIPSIPTPHLPSPGGGVPFIPGIASGGHIDRTGLAVVHRGEDVLPARVVNRGLAGASAGGGEVRVIVVGGDPQAIRYFQGLFNRYARGNGGRGMF